MDVSEPFTKESMSVNKPMSGAILPEFKIAMGEVLAFGADKYGRNNWAKCKPEEVYLYWDALHRHLDAYQAGEENDTETGLSHLGHAACNLMFLFKLTKGQNNEQK